jgi:hypothetical protein
VAYKKNLAVISENVVREMTAALASTLKMCYNLFLYILLPPYMEEIYTKRLQFGSSARHKIFEPNAKSTHL